MTEAHKLRGVMEATGNKPNVYTYASVIHGELLSGNSAEALELFSEMKQRGVIPDVVTYRTIILGLSKQERPDEALRLYDEMIEAGITLNERLYSSIAGSLDTDRLQLRINFVFVGEHKLPFYGSISNGSWTKFPSFFSTTVLLFRCFLSGFILQELEINWSITCLLQPSRLEEIGVGMIYAFKIYV
ncbi:hypothetical protein Q3G72_004757 [Acer saccharum]|nr:hypothetical protein Q3G72_004757 [Acer saccharum]